MTRVYLERVVDTQTVTPNGERTFSGFHESPALDGQVVVFYGATAGLTEVGIYLSTRGTFLLVAADLTMRPDDVVEHGRFTAFHPLFRFFEGDLAFVAEFDRLYPSSAPGRGVFLKHGTAPPGRFETIANNDLTPPGRTGVFNEFENAYLAGNFVTFDARSNYPDQIEGIYIWNGATLGLVVETGTLSPLNELPFLEFFLPQLGNNNVMFAGYVDFPPWYSHYRADASGIHPVVFEELPVSNNQGRLVGISTLYSYDGTIMAFTSSLDTGQKGVFHYDGKEVRGIVFNKSIVPEAGVIFTDFHETVATANGTTAFVALTTAGETSLFLSFGNTITRIVTVGHWLDRAAVSAVGIGPFGVSERSVAFHVDFEDGSEAIYFAFVSLCGDGVTELGEQCDNSGESPSCDSDCTLAMCGDDYTNPKSGEQCDDGNGIDGDGCQANCRFPACGDGIVDPGEQCDLGPSNSDIAPDVCREYCMLPQCGDGVVDLGEECDSGDDGGSSTCTASCLLIGTDAIPASTSWGMVVFALAIMSVAKSFGRRCWMRVT